MKIICFIDSLGSGGAQRQLINLAVGFQKRGHTVSFLTYHKIDFFKPIVDSHQISIKTIEESNYIKRIFKIRKYIRKSKPDALISFLEGSNFIATLSGFPFRNWISIVGERSANPDILKSKKLILYRYFHLFADYVVANSHANLNLVKKANPLIPNKKQKVIYNIIDLPENLESESTAKGNVTKITIAASYRYVKNLDGLIEAIKILPKKYRNQLKIDWYGNPEDTDYYNEMKTQINKNNLYGIINLHTVVEDIYQKYITSDYVGLFSRYEGFPNSICEAMALKKPVIVTNVSDVGLFIKQNHNGFVCNANDILSIKNAIISAIESSENCRDRMGNNNYESIMKNFNKEEILNKYLLLLRND